VLILLPPSEGKTPPAGRRRLDLASLRFPELTEARTTVLDTLTELCATDAATAATTLGLTPGLAGEVGRNATLRSAAAAPASRVYTGVLYEALDFPTLPGPARSRLTRGVLVASGLFGVVGLGDAIPAYRCPINVTLPGLGGLAAFWRGALTPVLDQARDGLVLDLRSGAYSAMWPAHTNRAAVVRVLHERAGTRTVVSHFNKATKGRLLRDLALAGSLPARPAALVEALRDLKYTVEAEPGAPWRIDVVVAEL
jgi:uncharacterized protein